MTVVRWSSFEVSHSTPPSSDVCHRLHQGCKSPGLKWRENPWRRTKGSELIRLSAVCCIEKSCMTLATILRRTRSIHPNVHIQPLPLWEPPTTPRLLSEPRDSRKLRIA